MNTDTISRVGTENCVIQRNPHLRSILAAVDLNTKLWAILNGDNLTFKLLTWDH